jgi:hypothetical protein
MSRALRQKHRQLPMTFANHQSPVANEKQTALEQLTGEAKLCG